MFVAFGLDNYGRICQLLTGRCGPLSAQRGGVDWQAVIAAAGRTRLLPGLGPALARCGLSDTVPGDLAELLDSAALLNGERNDGLLAQAADLARLLNASGIEPLFIKGVAQLLQATWPGPADRVVGDIDLLLPAERLDEAVALLRGSVEGARSLAMDPDQVPAKQHAASLCAADWTGLVEPHFALLASGYRQLLPAAEVWRESRHLLWRGVAVRVPSPTHQVQLALLHCFVAHRGYFQAVLRPRDLLDVVFLADRYGDEVDWRRIERELRAHGWGGMLLIAQQCISGLTGRDLPLLQQAGWCQRLDLARWQLQRRHAFLRALGRPYALIAQAIRGWRADDGARAFIWRKLADLQAYPRYLRWMWTQAVRP